MKWLAIASALLVTSVTFSSAALAHNPPGKAGGPGHGKYWHRNPAGPCGGKGKGWTYNPPGPGRVVYNNAPNVNPPGPIGGAGHGRYWRYNQAGPKGGAGQGWVHNPPGPNNRVVYR